MAMPDQKNDIPIPDRFWIVKAIYQFGIPSAIAVFLVWAMVERFESNLTAINSSVSAMHADLKGHTLDTAYVIKTVNETRQILLRICANTARTNDERRACFQTE